MRFQHNLLILAGTFALPSLFVLFNFPLLSPYITDSVPPGQLLYLLSKSLGLFALSLLTYQLLSGLSQAFLPNHYSKHIHPGTHWHAVLGAIICSLILSHALSFTMASSTRLGHFAWKLLTPSLTEGYYRTAVGIGAIALYLTLIAVIGRNIHWISKTKKNAVHKLAIVGYILVIIHAALIGSEILMFLTWMTIYWVFVLIKIYRKGVYQADKYV